MRDDCRLQTRKRTRPQLRPERAILTQMTGTVSLSKYRSVEGSTEEPAAGLEEKARLQILDERERQVYYDIQRSSPAAKPK